MKQNQGKTLYYEMRMPRKLLFQVSYFSHCVYMFDTDSSEGNLQNTYCIKMFENFFMRYSIFRIKDSSTEKKQELVVMQGGIEMVK